MRTFVPLRLLVLALWTAILSAGAAGADEKVNAVKHELAPLGRLRVAIAVSSAGGPFWSAKDAAGRPSGVPVELGRQLAHDLAVPVEYVMYDNSGQITDAAEKGEWDVTFVPLDAERAKRMAFGPVYNTDNSTFIVRPGSPIQSYDELDRAGVTVAAVDGTTTMRGAVQFLKHATVAGYRTYDEIIPLLREGRVEAFAYSQGGLVKLARTIPGARVLPGAFRQAKTAVAVPLGRPHALAYVSTFMDQAKSNGVLRRALDANGLADTAL
jgi:polar amino acid transport system substrate-binding protein